MKHLPGLLLLCAFAVGAAPPLAAQEGGPGEIKVEYRQGEDTTTITLNPLVLAARKQEELRMGAAYSYRGKTATRPDALALIFVSLSATDPNKYETANKLTIVADGRTYQLGPAKRTTQTQGGVTLELLVVGVPFDPFLQIAYAKDVTIKLGLTEIKPSADALGALRDFLRPRSAPAAK